MMKTYRMPEGTRVKWPSYCIVCADPHFRMTMAHGGMLSGMGWWGLWPTIKYQTISLQFPICNRHHLIFMTMRFLYFASFLVLILACAMLLAWTEFSISERVVVVSVIVFAFVIFLATLFYSPVKVSSDSTGMIAIKINNQSYAIAFEQLNKDDISCAKMKTTNQ